MGTSEESHVREKAAPKAGILVVAPAGYETVIYLDQELGQEFSLAREVRRQGGGHGGNLVHYLTMLGVRCALYTHWGDDEAGIEAARTLVGMCVDLSFCRIYSGHTSQSNFVLVEPGGEKRVTMSFGTALGEPAKIEAEKIPKFLYTSLLPVGPAFSLIDKARTEGSTVVVGVQLPSRVTAGLGLNHPEMVRAFSEADFIIGNRAVLGEELQTSLDAGEMCLMLSRHFPKLKGCVVTDGGAGSAALWGSQLCCQDTFRVDAVDSTGAGDIFTAVFIKEFLLQGKGLPETLLLASAYSALCCDRPGSRVVVAPGEVDRLIDLARSR